MKTLAIFFFESLMPIELLVYEACCVYSTFEGLDQVRHHTVVTLYIRETLLRG